MITEMATRPSPRGGLDVIGAGERILDDRLVWDAAEKRTRKHEIPHGILILWVRIRGR